jgi:hypothetical protein
MLWVKRRCQFWHNKTTYSANLTGQPIDDLKTAVVNKIEKGKIKKREKIKKTWIFEGFFGKWGGWR